MIALVDAQQHPERRDRFLDAVRGKPYFGDLLPAELTVFGAMRGGPVPRFFTATPAAALCLRGRGALLCGTYDTQETGGFLQLHGVEQVQTDGAPPAGYVREQRLFCMVYSGVKAAGDMGSILPGVPVPPGTPVSPAPSEVPASPDIFILPEVPVSPEMHLSPERTLPAELPVPPLPGLTLDKTPPPGETADFLMRAKGVTGAKGAEIRDNFYSELCVKRARGAACVWAVRQAGDEAGNETGNETGNEAGDEAGNEAANGRGKMIASAGAYALTPETAYLAAIETAGPLRGRGIGSRLVGTLAAQLAGEGRRVTLVCRENRVSFYERIGFRTESTIWRCTRETEV